MRRRHALLASRARMRQQRRWFARLAPQATTTTMPILPPHAIPAAMLRAVLALTLRRARRPVSTAAPASPISTRIRRQCARRARRGTRRSRHKRAALPVPRVGPTWTPTHPPAAIDVPWVATPRSLPRAAHCVLPAGRTLIPTPPRRAKHAPRARTPAPARTRARRVRPAGLTWTPTLRPCARCVIPAILRQPTPPCAQSVPRERQIWTCSHPRPAQRARWARTPPVRGHSAWRARPVAPTRTATPPRRVCRAAPGATATSMGPRSARRARLAPRPTHWPRPAPATARRAQRGSTVARRLWRVRRAPRARSRR